MQDLIIKNYEPPGPIALDFLNSQAFVRGIKGPVGSGKSVSCMFDLLNCAGCQEKGINGKRQTRFVIIRNTYAELYSTTIKTWNDWVPKNMGKWRNMPIPTHHIVTDEIDMEVLFLALDRPEQIKKVLSLEITMGYINEAKEIHEDIITAILGRIGRYPSMASKPAHIQKDKWPTFKGLIMDTNAPDEDHWLFHLMEEIKPKGWEFFHQPSGMSPHAENKKNLTYNYYENLIEANKHKPEWLKIYVHGNYGSIHSGKPVYPEYNDQVHCVDVEYDKNLGIIIGIDFGLTPAAVFFQEDTQGRWIAIDELVEVDMGAVEFGKALNKKINKEYPNAKFIQAYGDPAGDARSQSDGETAIAMINLAGIPCKAAPTNDPMLRRESIATGLNTNIGGVPAFRITPKCKQFRKGFLGGYKYKRIQMMGETRFRDVPDKNMFSHVHDAGQYGKSGGSGIKFLIKPKNSSSIRVVDSHYDDYDDSF